MISNRQILAVTIDGGVGGNGDSDESTKLGRREDFVGGGGRRDIRCVSGSVVVSGKTWRRQEICKRSRETWYYFFLCPSGTGGRCTLVMAEAEAKMEVGKNSEEVK